MRNTIITVITIGTTTITAIIIDILIYTQVIGTLVSNIAITTSNVLLQELKKA
jgi:hypothetical protein